MAGVEGGPGSAAGRQFAGQPEAEERCQLREVLGGGRGGLHSVPFGDGWRHCSSRSGNDGNGEALWSRSPASPEALMGAPDGGPIWWRTMPAHHGRS